ncbi:hypothetical protein [Cypionkella sp.]|uniref:hypothetical protein n=1 Tax=Cypionkella sp. TaxID=2811411 RepID=UPI002AC90C0B|nr:hypothetical protein [Cypionkella sp.]
MIWRDDPTTEVFRLWLVGWPLMLPRFAAGQHVVVIVAMPDGRQLKRAYSLAGRAVRCSTASPFARMLKPVVRCTEVPSYSVGWRSLPRRATPPTLTRAHR